MEPELRVELLEEGIVFLAEAQGPGVEIDGAVVLELHQAAADPRLLLVLREGLPQLLAGDGVELSKNPIEAAVRDEQVPGRLGPDGGHPGDVVGAVSHERQQIPQLSGSYAEALHDLVGPEDPIPHRVPEDDGGGDELHQVLVGAHDDDAQAIRRRPAHRGGNQIVRLHAALLEDGEPVGAHDLLASGQLHLEIVWSGWSVGLVFRVDVLAERHPARVHGDADQPRSALAEESLQHVDDPVDGVGGLTAGAREGRDRVVRPEDVAAEIDEVQDVGGLRLEQGGRHGDPGYRSGLPQPIGALPSRPCGRPPCQ